MGAVLIDVRNGVAEVTLNDSDHRNVLSPALVRGIHDAYDQAESDPSVRAAVLTGAGPAFCAGAELATLERAGAGDFSGVEEVYTGFLRVLESPVVTIAAVNGPAVGAGLNLALACDVRLAERASSFDARFVQMHLHPGGGHVSLLEQAVGRQTAAMMTVFGERLDADAAFRAGLVWRVYDGPSALVEAAVKIGHRLADHDREFVRALTSTLRRTHRLEEHGEAVDYERTMQRWSVLRPEFHTAIKQARQSVERRPSRSR